MTNNGGNAKNPTEAVAHWSATIQTATEQRDRNIAAMHDQGASLRTIAEAAGLSHQAVAKILKRVAALLLVVVLFAMVTGCSTTGGVATTTSTARETTTTAPTKTWPAKWCATQIGMTKAELVTIMGTPSKDNPGFVEWIEGQFHFTASFFTSSTVEILDTDASNLSSADRAEFTCEFGRTLTAP